MVSSEGTCRIWHQYGRQTRLAESVGVSVGGTAIGSGVTK
jgi:hypothetical protein